MSLAGDKPWKCAGWIPVVSGNMSFTEIGKTAIARKFTVINNVAADGYGQTILVFGRKPLNDGWLPSWLRRDLERIETRFYFLMVVRSSPSKSKHREKLSGFIAFSIDDRVLREIAARFHQDIHGAPFSSVPADLLPDPFSYFAAVDIHRDGRCDIELPGRYPEANALDVARQFFIFIKDVAHHHYHHRLADSITYAHLYSDEMEWRRETIYSLHRAMVSARRYMAQERLRGALGISAYAETFEAAFLAPDKLPKGKSFAQYSYEPIRTSINSLIEESRLRIERRLSNIVVVTSLLLSLVALIIAVPQIKTNATWPGWVTYFFSFAVGHPGLSLTIAFVAYVAVLTVASHENRVNGWGLKLGRAIYARLGFLNRIWMALVLWIVAVLIAWTSRFLLDWFWHLDAVRAQGG